MKEHTRKQSKERLPLDLPVEEIDYRLHEAQCPDCQSHYEEIGTDVRETLKLVPAKAYILRERIHVYACRACETETEATPIVKAEFPPAVIPGSIESAEAVAQVMTQKFALALPLYRQEQDWKSQGILLSRQTMSNWLLNCSERYFKVLIDMMKQKLQKQSILHADEPPLQVLPEPDKPPQSKSYMWLYRSGIHSTEPLLSMPISRIARLTGQRPFCIHLKAIYIVMDTSVIRHCLQRLRLVGCWAHARRKFDEALKAQSPKTRKQSLAYEGKQRCDVLFGIEGQGKEMTTADRYQLRQDKAKPLVDSFFVWVKTLAVGKTTFGKAVTYCIHQESNLRRYLEHGDLEISNNLGERSIKPFVIGRKNFLFCNTPKGADASARIYSLVETAKANQMSPYDYLLWILKLAPGLDLVNHPERAEKLLPKYSPR